jgi:acetyl-CoA acetyltransferase
MPDQKDNRWEGREVVIVEAVRTPIGRGHREKGWFRDVHPNELLGATYKAVIERAGIEAELVEDVIAGAVTQVGEQSSNIARNAWLQTGLPVTTPASTVDRQCGSAQQAVSFAAGLIAAGVHDVMIGAGVEHMGRVPMGSNVAHVNEFGTPFPPALMERYDLVSQGLSAELIAERWEVTRAEQDELGLRSHQLAARATDEGRFEREIIPFAVNGSAYATDQGIRRDTSLEQLAVQQAAAPGEGIGQQALLDGPDPDTRSGVPVDELFRASVGNNAAAADDEQVVGGLGHLAHQVAGQEHRAALGGQRLHQVPDPHDAVGVQAVDRLVEQHRLGVAEQGRGDAEPLVHAE